MLEGVHDRFAYLRDRFPGFWRWVCSEGTVLQDFDPGRWALPEWEARLTPGFLADEMEHVPPDGYPTMLRAACFVRSRRNGWYIPFDDLGATLLHARESLSPAPREVRAPGGFPFADSGVDAEHYHLYFDREDTVVALYTEDQDLIYFYSGLRPWLISRILIALELAERGAPTREAGAYLEAAALMLALDLNLPDGPSGEFHEAEHATVEAWVRAGRFPALRRWLAPDMPEPEVPQEPLTPSNVELAPPPAPHLHVTAEPTIRGMAFSLDLPNGTARLQAGRERGSLLEHLNAPEGTDYWVLFNLKVPETCAGTPEVQQLVWYCLQFIDGRGDGTIIDLECASLSQACQGSTRAFYQQLGFRKVKGEIDGFGEPMVRAPRLRSG